MGGDGEGQTYVHAGGVVFDGRVDELFKFGEGDDFVEFAADLALAHAEDRAGKEGVFATSQLGMKASADFKERSNAAADFRPAAGRARNAREDFQESGLAFADVERGFF